MSGTVEGGRKAAATNIARYGKDFYRERGRIGGSRSRGGGFAADVRCYCKVIPTAHFKRNCAGTIGGRLSRRGKKGYEGKLKAAM